MCINLYSCVFKEIILLCYIFVVESLRVFLERVSECFNLLHSPCCRVRFPSSRPWVFPEAFSKSFFGRLEWLESSPVCLVLAIVCSVLMYSYQVQSTCSWKNVILWHDIRLWPKHKQVYKILDLKHINLSSHKRRLADDLWIDLPQRHRWVYYILCLF